MKDLNSVYRAIVLAAGILLITPALASASPEQSPQQATSVVNQPAGRSDVTVTKPTLAGQYAGRANKEIAAFEGGGAGIYIGGSTAAIVLLLVILIVVL